MCSTWLKSRIPSYEGIILFYLRTFVTFMDTQLRHRVCCLFIWDFSFGPGHASTATTESGISMKDAYQKQSRPIISLPSKRLREGSCSDGSQSQIRNNSRRRENCRRTEASSEEHGRWAQRGRSNGPILESFVFLFFLLRCVWHERLRERTISETRSFAPLATRSLSS